MSSCRAGRHGVDSRLLRERKGKRAANRNIFEHSAILQVLAEQRRPALRLPGSHDQAVPPAPICGCAGLNGVSQVSTRAETRQGCARHAIEANRVQDAMRALGMPDRYAHDRPLGGEAADKPPAEEPGAAEHADRVHGIPSGMLDKARSASNK